MSYQQRVYAQPVLQLASSIRVPEGRRVSRICIPKAEALPRRALGKFWRHRPADADDERAATSTREYTDSMTRERTHIERTNSSLLLCGNTRAHPATYLRDTCTMRVQTSCGVTGTIRNWCLHAKYGASDFGDQSKVEKSN